MRKVATLVITLLALAAVACGDGMVGPESSGDPGSGTRTAANNNHFDSDFFSARFRSNGRHDLSYGGDSPDGILHVDIRRGSDDEGGYAVMDPSDRLVQVGGTMPDHGGSASKFALSRSLSDGRLDSHFAGGTTITNFSSTTSEEATAVTRDSSGRLLVAGTGKVSASQGNTQFVLARYTASGGLDTTFGSGGKVRTNFSSTTNEHATAVAVDAAGKVVVAGWGERHGQRQIVLVRYNTNGSRDASFGSDGKVRTNFVRTSSEQAEAVAITPSGKVVLAGHGYFSGQDVILLARYNTNGTLDTSFNRPSGMMAKTYGGSTATDKNGKLLSRLFSSSHTRALDLAIDASGRYVVAGEVCKSGCRFLVARYHASGRLDYGFNGKGYSVTNFASSSTERARAMVLDSAGRIVLAGSGHVRSTRTAILLVRHRADGSRDTSFDSDGKVLVAYGSNNLRVRGVTLDSSGRILVSGETGMNRTCQPRSSYACTCSNGVSGTQICNSAGSDYSACGPCRLCTPGDSRSCTCSGSRSGNETCNSAGTAWGSCACTGPRLSTNTIRLYRLTTPVWYSGPQPYGYTLRRDGNLQRITLPSSLSAPTYGIGWVSFPKAGHDANDCGHPDRVVTLTPGESTTSSEMEDLFGSATPSLRYGMYIVACYGPPSATPLPNFPVEVTYTY